MFKKKSIAHQQFRCNGKQGCLPQCRVEMVIRYFADKNVEIRAASTDHGPNFSPTLQKNLQKKIWHDVSEYFHLKERGYFNVKPDEIILYIAKHPVCSKKMCILNLY